MSRKIIFLDIDGTVISHRTYLISDSTRNAIREAQKNGHLVFINTGRTLAEMGDEILQVGFDGLICGCGTYITHGDRVLLQKTVPSYLIPSLLSDFRKYGIEALLEGSAAIYYERQALIQNPIMMKIKYDHTVRHKFNVASWEDTGIAFDKFCMWPSTEAVLKQFTKKYEENFDFIHRGGDFYEAVPKGYSKATGIEFILKQLDIAHEDTYAIGDSSNDLPMLEYVKYSIAMGNSSQEVLSMASYITKDVDDDGIACALKYYGII